VCIVLFVTFKLFCSLYQVISLSGHKSVKKYLPVWPISFVRQCEQCIFSRSLCSEANRVFSSCLKVVNELHTNPHASLSNLYTNFPYRLFVCINPLPSESRLPCCDRYIRCQRSLAVKPLTMSGSPSPCVEWAGLRLRMYRYAAARCVRWQIDVDVRKQLRVGRRRPQRVQWRFLNGRARQRDFLDGRRASTAGFRTLQVKPQSRKARLWLVIH